MMTLYSSSGHYPHNADCLWTISVTPGKTIQFHFALLNIESHPDCGYDKLGESCSDFNIHHNPVFNLVQCSEVTKAVYSIKY